MPLLPAGVRLHPLSSHVDDRGSFTELFRDEWSLGIAPVQWNAVHSTTGVLRGVHAHISHADLLTVVAGSAAIGLHDLRAGSPTEGLSAVLTLTGAAMQLIAIPPGVAHGFCFTEPSVHVYAVDRYWDTADELGCRYDDPGLGIDWPVEAPMLSARDERLGSLEALRAAFASVAAAR